MLSKGAFTDKLELYRIDGELDTSKPITEIDLLEAGYKDLETKYNLNQLRSIKSPWIIPLY